MTIINPYTLGRNQDKASMLACSLVKVNEMIREIIKNEIEMTGDDYEGPLDGIDALLDCLIENCNGLSTEFERMKYWAEYCNIDIEYRAYYGKDTLLIDRSGKRPNDAVTCYTHATP